MNARQQTQTAIIGKDARAALCLIGILLLSALVLALAPAAQATTTWARGGTFTVSMSSAAGLTGSGHTTLLADAGGLSVTSSARKYFTVALTSNGGDAADFDATQSYVWRIVSAPAGLIRGYHAGNVRLDATGFTNDLQGGRLDLQLGEDNKALDIIFTPAEPVDFLGAPLVGDGAASFVAGSHQTISWSMNQTVKSGYFNIVATSPDGERSYLLKTMHARGRCCYAMNWKVNLAPGSGWYVTVDYNSGSGDDAGTISSYDGDLFDVIAR